MALVRPVHADGALGPAIGGDFAEREEANPWPALHVERGFDADASTATVFAVDAPVSISAAYWHFVDFIWLTVFFTFYVTPHLG